MYQSNRSLNMTPLGGQPPGHLHFWKICVQIPPPKAEKLFKCPIVGPIQVIKCPQTPGNFSVASIMLWKLCNYVNMV